MSPVRTNPLTRRSLVASSFSQKPTICPSQRTAISPPRRPATALPSSSWISTSANGSGRPAERSGLDPSTWANHCRGPIIVTGTASVWP